MSPCARLAFPWLRTKRRPPRTTREAVVVLRPVVEAVASDPAAVVVTTRPINFFPSSPLEIFARRCRKPGLRNIILLCL